MKNRALIFEQDVLNRDLIKSLLEARSYDTKTYSSPLKCSYVSKCVDECKAQTACADVIFADLSLKKINFLEFVKHLRAINCKVKNIGIMISALPEEKLKEIEKLDCKPFYKPLNWQVATKWLEFCEDEIFIERKLEEILAVI